MKTKSLGIANIIFGFLGIFVSYINFGAKKALSVMQTEVGMPESMAVKIFPYICILAIVYMVYAIYFGIKLFLVRDSTGDYRKKAERNLAISVVIILFVIIYSKFSLIASLYTITESL